MKYYTELHKDLVELREKWRKIIEKIEDEHDRWALNNNLSGLDSSIYFTGENAKGETDETA